MSNIFNILKTKKKYIQTNFSVTSLGLFGSHARNEANDNSDIDILVTFKEPTFDHYMDLKFYLEGIFKKPVDIVMEKTIKPRLKQSILQNTLYV